MVEIVVYATDSRADRARSLLNSACGSTGISARLELYGSGSLYQRLGPRHGPPPPDIIIWFGPFAAAAAAASGFLQRYAPPQLPEGWAHDPDWNWTTLEYSPISIIGPSPADSWHDLPAVPRLALPDPERSEAGLAILLATLDRARQVEGDAENGWAWWRQRAQVGLMLAEDEAAAANLVATGDATHALVLSGGVPVLDLPALPHALSLAAASPGADQARRLLDALPFDSGQPRTSVSLDVSWSFQQYTATRARWSQSAFGPTLRPR
jgi:hypothetical protein